MIITKYLDICPTWQCNAKCPTCNSYKLGNQSLSIEQTQMIINEFQDLDRLVIEGGEPTLWKYLEYFVSQMLMTNVKKIAIITNGFATKRLENFGGIFDDFKDRLIFYISLNGIDKMHDLSRGIKGAFEKTTKSAFILKKMNYPVFFSFIGLKKNIDEYDKVKRFANYKNISTSVCLYSTRSKFEGHTWEAANEDKFYELLEKKLYEYNGFAKLAYKYLIKSLKKKKILPCDAGKIMLHINPYGIIKPCSMDEKMVLGHITNNSIKWKDNKEIKRILKRIPSKCQYQDGKICNDCYIFYTLMNNKIATLMRSLLWFL